MAAEERTVAEVADAGTRPAGSLREQIESIVRSLPADQVTLGEIRDLAGREGLLLLVAFLTLVFLVPVSIPGVSTIFGAAILLIGVSRIFDRALWLPRRFAERPLPAAKLRAALDQGAVWVLRLERISRPHRLSWLTRWRAMRLVNDLALTLAAVLLMAPFGFIPFSNTLPGVALLLFAVGLMQRDGAAILLGHLANLATLVYFGALIVGGGAFLNQIIQFFTGRG